MRTILLLLVGMTIPTAAAMAQGYSVTTTTTTTKRADGTTTVETTRSVPYSAARCQRLQIDRNMLVDQLRRTGWKLEQDNVRAQLMQIEEEMAARGC